MNSISREQTQVTNTLGCGEALREMMHVLLHTDIFSSINIGMNISNNYE